MSFRGALLKPSEKGERRPAATRSIAKGSRYEILKDKIRTWWDDRFKIGEYLKEIKDGKLYKPEYPSFEEFSEGEFGIKQAYAYRLIEASDVRASLGNSTIVEKLERPSQAHALAAVPEEKRVEVLTEAAKAPGPVTAKRITEAAAKAPRIEKAVILDKTGYPIPESILPEWNRAAEFDSTLREISKIKSIIEKATDDKDPIFVEVGNAAIAHLKNAYSDLTCVIPYAVCTSCQGRIPDKCTFCLGRGFISKFRYSLVPSQTRDMREKMRERRA